MDKLFKNFFEEKGDVIIETIIVSAIRIALAVLIVFIGWKITKAITNGMMRKKPKKMDPAIHSFIKSCFSITAKTVTVIVAALVLGVPLTAFTTVLASGGVAIGLALQGALSNLAGGLIILVSKPFDIGDEIEVEGKFGVVTSINIFYTVITTYSHETLTLPNGKVTNATISNRSLESKRRVEIDFSVAYGSDFDKVRAVALQTAKRDPFTVDDPKTSVVLIKAASSSIDFRLFAWCAPKDYWDCYFSLNENIIRDIESAGISIPFPQLDVHVKEK